MFLIDEVSYWRYVAKFNDVKEHLWQAIKLLVDAEQIITVDQMDSARAVLLKDAEEYEGAIKIVRHSMMGYIAELEKH
jgi:hypothetical protein